MKKYDELLLSFRSHPLYQELKRDLRDARPVIPVFDPSTDNTETWKANSMKQEGFDLCLALLQINLKE